MSPEILQQGGLAVVDTPEAHGAKRDGKLITDATITAGPVLSSALTTFTAGDVGKVVAINAGNTLNGSPTTVFANIVTFTDAHHVAITARDGATINATASANAVYGTDDTAAVKAAVANVVQSAQAAGLSAGRVALSEGIYMIAGATTKEHVMYYGNAQIPLPIVAPVPNDKFVLEISGPSDCAAPTHWAQTTPHLPGACLFSTLYAQANDSSYGFPSVIAGPNTTAFGTFGYPAGWHQSNNVWSNMHLAVRNMSLVTATNPSQNGFDLRCVACASLDGVGLYTFDVPANQDSQTGGLNGQGVGVYMPGINNNDYQEVGTLTIYAWPVGVSAPDHFNAKSLRMIYCKSGVMPAPQLGSNSLTHGAHIEYLSAEACISAIDASILESSSTVPTFPFTVAHMDTEVTGTWDINDPDNYLSGVIWVGNINNTGGVPLVNGAGNARVTAFYQERGHVAAPSVPATTVALTNPFWRDCAVTVSGGTVTAVAVDGTATGVTSGTVVVPSGKTITLTYSAAPSWNWVVL